MNHCFKIFFILKIFDNYFEEGKKFGYSSVGKLLKIVQFTIYSPILMVHYGNLSHFID